MGKFFLRPLALNDLEGIWEYTFATWGEEQAERYLHELNWAFEELARHPKLGRSCDVIREGYRKHLVGSHVVFYRVDDQDIEIVRVLHSSMDFQSHL